VERRHEHAQAWRILIAPPANFREQIGRISWVVFTTSGDDQIIKGRFVRLLVSQILELNGRWRFIGVDGSG